ncbi:O-antigen ligase family protein [Sphingopyxis sp.]|uniref:O-antigen ligase family protein n=1 Tax=Sphingopyxis sp. TaxID=1908224 RepID=UPI003D1433C7
MTPSSPLYHGAFELDRSLLNRNFERPERLGRMLLGAACFFLCWHILRSQALNFSLSDLLFLICFLIMIVRNRLNIMAMQAMTAPWLISLSMMLGGLLLGSIFNGDPLRWLNVASQYLFGFLLLPMILMSEDRDWVRRCLVYFVYGVVIAQLIALLAGEFLPYEQTKEIFSPRFVTGNGRIGGMVSDANLNGGVVAYAIIALLNGYHFGLIRPFLTLCLGTILIWSLLASASFTAFSATCVALTVYFLLSNPVRFLKFGIPLILLFVAYVAFDMPLPAAFTDRVLGAVLSGDLNQAGTFTQRSALIADAWNMSKDTLFVGLGVDEFRKASSFGIPVHQLWLLMLTEGGVLSLAGLAAMFAVLGVMGMKALGFHREDGATVLAMLAILMIFSTSIPHMYNRLWIAPLMLALAAAFARPSLRFWAADGGEGEPFEPLEHPINLSAQERRS